MTPFEDTRTKASAYDDQHREAYDPIRRPYMSQLARVVSATLPGLGLPQSATAGSQQTYAPWPVWRDSTKVVNFMPLPKKKAAKIWHKARSFERRTRQPGKQDGALGRDGLLVLHALAIATIARKANMSVSSVKRGLANLKAAGVLHWVRRAAETRDEQGRFCQY